MLWSLLILAALAVYFLYRIHCQLSAMDKRLRRAEIYVYGVSADFEPTNDTSPLDKVLRLRSLYEEAKNSDILGMYVSEASRPGELGKALAEHRWNKMKAEMGPAFAKFLEEQNTKRRTQ